MGWLYLTSGTSGVWVFLLVTLAMGGSAAYVTGRAVAETWRPFLHVAGYVALLALAVRFLQFALFAQPFLAPVNLIVDALVLLVLGALGYRMKRAEQMATQYRFHVRPEVSGESVNPQQ